MNKRFFYTLLLSISAVVFIAQVGSAKGNVNKANCISVDSAASRATVMGIINSVIKSSGSFDISAVSDFYAPNAVVADEEPPFSWNGPTAGAQWVSTIEKTCKELKLKDLRGKIGKVSIYLQTDESIYVVVPVDYTGEIKGEPFSEDGAFTFVFRMVNDKWLIKSQVWITKRGL